MLFIFQRLYSDRTKYDILMYKMYKIDAEQLYIMFFAFLWMLFFNAFSYQRVISICIVISIFHLTK